MDLLELMQNRHSIRKYTGEEISEKDILAVLQAGMLSESGRARRPWELLVIKDRSVLKKMTGCRAGAANMLNEAAAAVVVIGNEELSDTWVEDCAIVMSRMHLMAASLGLGSCWIEGRLRPAADGRTAEEFLRELLGYPENFRLAAVLSLGKPESRPAKKELSKLPESKIHWERF